MLNWVSMEVSGEANFLDVCMARMKVPVVFDVGADVGNYTMEVVGRNPRAHVYAFEPHPKNFAKLTELADLPNVTALNIGLGDTEGELPFFGCRDEDGSTLASVYREVIETLRHKESVEYRVPIRRLVDVADEYGVRHIAPRRYRGA